MAKAKSSSTPKSELTGLASILANIGAEVGVKESRSYKPVTTGIDVLDYFNARYFFNYETNEYELFMGAPMGKLILKIGNTGSGKTTLAVQEAMSMVAPYEQGSVFHFDLENAWSVERTADICGLPIEVVRQKYHRFDPVSLDKIYAFVKKVINAKQAAMREDPSVMVTDVRSGETIPVPTVIIIDTVAALQSEKVLAENEEMGSLMFEKGQQAGANNAFAQRLAGMIGDPNITIIAVNHIRELIQDGPTRKAKKVQYLNADETTPGGTGFPQYSDYYLKMQPVESLTNKMDEGFAIPGKIVRCTIVKSRLSFDGRQFELVLTGDGFSNTWTNLHFLKSQKLLKGAGAHMFVEAPDGRTTVKFAQRKWAELYDNDATFREIADARILQALLDLVPEPGTTAIECPAEEQEEQG